MSEYKETGNEMNEETKYTKVHIQKMSWGFRREIQVTSILAIEEALVEPFQEASVEPFQEASVEAFREASAGAFREAFQVAYRPETDAAVVVQAEAVESSRVVVVEPMWEEATAVAEEPTGRPE